MRVEPKLLEPILSHINIGVIVVDRECRVVVWNDFMETHSGITGDAIVGKNLFDTFPELPRPWLEKKLETVFLLGSYAFTNWQERPYLIRMPHNRPITGGVDCMRHNCTFLPVRNVGAEVNHVCITISDVTDVAISEERLQEAMRKIEVLSTEDSLTGLCNRRQMQVQLELEVARSLRYGTPLSFVLIDFDHFKTINDTFGHLCGDRVLTEIASRIKGVIRDADIAARFGGEEFALILPMTDLSGAQDVAERARRCVEEAPVEFETEKVSLTISGGIALLGEGKKDVDSLIGAADRALYAAKRAGRNCVITAEAAGDAAQKTSK